MQYTNAIIKNRKIKLFLWILFGVITVTSFLYLVTIGESNLFLLLILAGGVGLIIVSYLTTKFYTWSIVSFFIVFVGLFFKRQHYPLAGTLITLGTFFLILVSLFNSVKFLITFRKNQFLKWIGCISGVIITLFMTGLVFRFQHWGGIIREYSAYAGSLLFVVTVFAIVFTLPNSNYVAWSPVERKVFSRSVLVPMIFVFGLITLIFVFPDVFSSIFPRGSLPLPWNSYDIELYSLPGIPLI
jgi:hypothetical protein